MRPNLPSVLTPMNREKSSGCGCLGGGCAIALVVFLLIGGALFWGAYSTFNGIKSMTAMEAKAIPVYNATDAELQAVLAKVKTFNTAYDAGQEGEIQLSANEINTLIARYEPWSALRGRALAVIEGDHVGAQVSLPLSQIRLMQDRFFNGDVSISFVNENGRPKPNIVTVRSGDVEFPRWAMRYITSKQFVEGLGVPSLSEPDSIGANLTAIEVRDNKLVVRAKKGS